MPVFLSRTVLTAAHCIVAVFRFGSLSSELRIRVGSNRWNNGGVTYTLSSNATHEHYESTSRKNDLGVLYTRTPIVFSETICAIALDFEHVGAEIQTRAAGWGRTRTAGPVSNLLMELDVITMSGPRCVEEMARTVTSLVVEPNIELCTRHPNGSGRGMCTGDSGSALVRLDHGSQIGIVSWGVLCARGAPDIFVRVSAYENWLQKHIR
ncbi:hypothetical protein evm_007154 [Chilo suppressalis]|nr:hypothetical protein evm_007154 [Chilo suppressalis]